MTLTEPAMPWSPKVAVVKPIAIEGSTPPGSRGSSVTRRPIATEVKSTSRNQGSFDTRHRSTTGGGTPSRSRRNSNNRCREQDAFRDVFRSRAGSRPRDPRWPITGGCRSCGAGDYHPWRSCPAKDKKCHKCSMTGGGKSRPNGTRVRDLGGGGETEGVPHLALKRGIAPNHNWLLSPADRGDTRPLPHGDEEMKHVVKRWPERTQSRTKILTSLSILKRRAHRQRHTRV